MPIRLIALLGLLLAWSSGVARAADEPVATAPIPPAGQASPQQPLFVAPTVTMPKKPAAAPKHQAAAAAPQHRPARPKVRVAAVHPRPAPVRHVQRERPQYYARVYPPAPAPVQYYPEPEVEAPPMAPPAWMGRGYPPEYPYPGFRRW